MKAIEPQITTTGKITINCKNCQNVPETQTGNRVPLDLDSENTVSARQDKQVKVKLTKNVCIPLLATLTIKELWKHPLFNMQGFVFSKKDHLPRKGSWTVHHRMKGLEGREGGRLWLYFLAR